MAKYENIEPNYTPRVDLNVVAKSFDTMQQNRLKAIEQRNSIKATLASLPVNEAEQGFVNALAEQVNAEIENASLFGDMSYALDDILRISGDIASNPGLNGRIKYNTEREAWIKSIQDDKTLDQDTKDYLIAKNQYDYHDNYGIKRITNPDGTITEERVVVGGNKWKPVEEAQGMFDINAMVTNAMKLLVPNTYGDQKYTYRDANGAILEDYAPGAQIYVTENGSETRLSRDRIKNLVLKQIAANTKSYDQIRQYLNAQDFVTKRDNIDIKERSDIYDNLGNLKSVQQYIRDLIDPMSSVLEYYKIERSSKITQPKVVKPNSGSTVEIPKTHNGNGETTGAPSYSSQTKVNPPEYLGGEMNKRNDANGQAFGDMVEDVQTDSTKVNAINYDRR